MICCHMTNLPLQYFLKLFFYFARPDPKLIQNPNCYISLKSIYNLWKNVHLRIFIFGCRGLRNSPWKKILTKKFTKNKHVYTPKTLPFGHEMKKNIFFHDSHSIVSRKLVLYVQIDPRGQIWHFEKKYIYWKLATIKK